MHQLWHKTLLFVVQFRKPWCSTSTCCTQCWYLGHYHRAQDRPSLQGCSSTLSRRHCSDVRAKHGLSSGSSSLPRSQPPPRHLRTSIQPPSHHFRAGYNSTGAPETDFCARNSEYWNSRCDLDVASSPQHIPVILANRKIASCCSSRAN